MKLAKMKKQPFQAPEIILVSVNGRVRFTHASTFILQGL